MESVVVIGGFPGYKVSQDGIIYSTAAGAPFPLKPSYIRKYPSVKLRAHGKYKDMLVHRIVAEAFCPNPEGKPYVNHIDGDPRNARASNLEWCTASENASHAVRTGLTPISHKGIAVQQVCPTTGLVLACFGSIAEAAAAVGRDSGSIKVVLDRPARASAGFRWRTIADIPAHPNEEWKPISACDGYELTDPPYAASSAGRIRSERNGRIISQATKCGYLAVGLYTRAGRHVFWVHRLVATVFLGQPSEQKRYVNHIDRNRANNSVANLEWVTHGENMQKASGRAVMQIDAVTNAVYAVYASQSEAARALRVHQTAINNAVRFGGKCAGFLWRPVEPAPNSNESPKFTDEDFRQILDELFG